MRKGYDKQAGPLRPCRKTAPAPHDATAVAPARGSRQASGGGTRPKTSSRPHEIPETATLDLFANT